MTELLTVVFFLQQKEMQELKLHSSNSGSPHRWPAENYGPDSVPDGYQGSQTFHGAPLTG